jgi:plasmid replication initiation protein
MARISRFDTQLDLFIADASFVRHADLAPLMATSWFSLSKNPRFQPIVHEYDKYRVEVRPASDKGLATIWDHDVMIFLVSQLIGAHNRGESTSPRIRFTGYELFRFMRMKWHGGAVGKKNYDLLWDALERLHGTHIHTNIKSHGQIESADIEFYWLPHIERLKLRSQKEVGYEVHLDPKVYEWTQDVKNALILDRGYFDLTSGLDRFLYLWGRKSAGRQQQADWTERFDLVREKSGSLLAKGQFNHLLRKSIKRNILPGYELEELIGKSGPQLQVRRRTGIDLLQTPKQLKLLMDQPSEN